MGFQLARKSHNAHERRQNIVFSMEIGSAFVEILKRPLRILQTEGFPKWLCRSDGKEKAFVEPVAERFQVRSNWHLAEWFCLPVGGNEILPACRWRRNDRQKIKLERPSLKYHRTLFQYVASILKSNNQGIPCRFGEKHKLQ